MYLRKRVLKFTGTPMKASKVKSDYGTIERRQHGDILELQETVQVGVRVLRNKTDSVLNRYHERRLLDKQNPKENDRLFEAGERLKAHYTIAGMEPQVIMHYQDYVSGGGESVGDRVIDAKTKFREAMKAVGPIASSEVISVCCTDQAIGEFRMEILRRGLRVLADHYGL